MRLTDSEVNTPWERRIIVQAIKLNKTGKGQSYARKSNIKNWLMQHPLAFETVIKNAALIQVLLDRRKEYEQSR